MGTNKHKLHLSTTQLLLQLRFEEKCKIKVRNKIDRIFQYFYVLVLSSILPCVYQEWYIGKYIYGLHYFKLNFTIKNICPAMLIMYVISFQNLFLFFTLAVVSNINNIFPLHSYFYFIKCFFITTYTEFKTEHFCNTHV